MFGRKQGRKKVARRDHASSDALPPIDPEPPIDSEPPNERRPPHLVVMPGEQDAGEVAGTWLTAGPVRLHLGLQMVLVGERCSTLRRREAELLEFLMRRAGETFDRQELLEEVWGYDVGDASTVTVHIRRLRQKIEDDPAHPNLLVTVWGVGYCLATEAAN